MYELTIRKVDSEDRTQTLSGARFRYSLILDSKATLSPTGKIGDYNVYHKPEWEFDIGADGTYTIEKDADWGLEPGNYYILEELRAPSGYELQTEPIIFYCGYKNDMDTNTSPGALLALPNGSLTITNTKLPPSPGPLPDTGGPGVPVVILPAVSLLSAAFFLGRRRERD